ncbi:MAG: hypothetical protein H7232_16060 [Aeromicrobium sp.]|nr:hypothetical protein [Burkholderiales bacterium]
MQKQLQGALKENAKATSGGFNGKCKSNYEGNYKDNYKGNFYCSVARVSEGSHHPADHTIRIKQRNQNPK